MASEDDDDEEEEEEEEAEKQEQVAALATASSSSTMTSAGTQQQQGSVIASSSLSGKKTLKKHARDTNHWTPEEDSRLLQATITVRQRTEQGSKIANYWASVAQLVKGRTAKQCRERFKFNLDPDIRKEEFTEAEDTMILTKQKELGNRWALISSFIPGRTENAVKTRYKSIKRAQEKAWRKEEDEAILEAIGSIKNDQSKSFHLQEAYAKLLGRNIAGIHRTRNALKTRFKFLSSGSKETYRLGDPLQSELARAGIGRNSAEEEDDDEDEEEDTDVEKEPVRKSSKDSALGDLVRMGKQGLTGSASIHDRGISSPIRKRRRGGQRDKNLETTPSSASLPVRQNALQHSGNIHNVRTRAAITATASPSSQYLSSTPKKDNVLRQDLDSSSGKEEALGSISDFQSSSQGESNESAPVANNSEGGVFRSAGKKPLKISSEHMHAGSKPELVAFGSDITIDGTSSPRYQFFDCIGEDGTEFHRSLLSSPFDEGILPLISPTNNNQLTSFTFNLGDSLPPVPNFLAAAVAATDTHATGSSGERSYSIEQVGNGISPSLMSFQASARRRESSDMAMLYAATTVHATIPYVGYSNSGNSSSNNVNSTSTRMFPPQRHQRVGSPLPGQTTRNEPSAHQA